MPSSESAYPNTPQAFLTYTCPKLEDAFMRQGEEGTRRTIDELFQVSCETTGLTPDALLARLSFDPNNKDDDMIQSLFGVMRTITMLRDLGFTDIMPLPASKTQKEADLVAKRDEALYVVEVFRANERQWRYPGYKCEDYIATRYTNEKKFQLEATMARYGCPKAIVAIVFDSISKALLENSDIQEVVETVHLRTGSPPDTHFLLFTGTQSSPYSGNDVAVSPPLI